MMPVEKKRKVNDVSVIESFCDGYSGDKIFIDKSNCAAYTFDDIIIMPGHVSSESNEIELKTKVSRNIALNLPLLSSPMDTVTEHNMAIAMALQGAIGM